MNVTPTGARASILAAAIALVAALPVGLSADRLNDKDVKELVDRIDSERDRFEDQLDGKLKRSIIRGPRGEVNVERYLDDLQENMDKLKGRFTREYAASAEVTTVLRMASDIDRYMSTLPPDFDGASEWKRLASSLGELAGAYGVSLPLSDSVQARRLNDREVQVTASNVAKSADAYRKALASSLKQDRSIPPATRDASVSDANALKDDAKKLASLVGDGRPATGEAQALLRRAAAVRSAAAGRTLSAGAQSAWGDVSTGLEKVAQAFNLPRPTP
jgi:hypothetical protein